VVAPSAGKAVVVPFPFSDLSQAKLRPAVVLAHAGRGDWILCQVTSNPYGDRHAVKTTDADFETGSLRTDSYARPGKPFTASRDLIRAEVGTLTKEAFERIIAATVELLQGTLGPSRPQAR